MIVSFLLVAAVVGAPPSIPGYRVKIAGDWVQVVSARRELSIVPPGMPLRRSKGLEALRIVRGFVFAHPAVFGLDAHVDSLALRQAAAAAKGYYVVTRQWHRGRPVTNAESNAYVDVGHDVVRLEGWFERGIDVDPRPTLTAEQARRIAAPRHPAVSGIDPRVDPLCYRRVRDGVHLLYPVFLPRPGLPAFRVSVDAHSGAILEDIAMPPSER